MKRFLILLATCWLIAGCSSIPIPSLDYCSDVLYHRQQNTIDIQLKCQTIPLSLTR
jgi:uncharacterized protein YceK